MNSQTAPCFKVFEMLVYASKSGYFSYGYLSKGKRRLVVDGTLPYISISMDGIWKLGTLARERDGKLNGHCLLVLQYGNLRVRKTTRIGSQNISVMLHVCGVHECWQYILCACVTSILIEQFDSNLRK